MRANPETYFWIFVVGGYLLGAIINIVSIGKERAVRTPGEVAMGVCLSTALVAVAAWMLL